MLTTLRIKNLALVPDLALDLRPGFNVITGETGAGKSIIVGALNLVLGERADRTLIRSGADHCSVEAIFDLAPLRAPVPAFLADNGLEPCEENQLLLKRVFSSTGANRQFVNGSPTTLNILGSLGEWLVDMHGPHEHQSLLHPARQLAILDAFGQLEDLREQFGALFRRRLEWSREKATLIVDEQTYTQQLDLLRFQTREISAARLRPDEETEVEQEYKRASNAARLLELSQAALDQLSESENSLLSQAGVMGRTIQEIQRLDPSASCLLSLHGQAVQALRDVQSDLSHYADKIDLNPARLHELEERLNLIQSLKRKYGATVEAVIEFGEQAELKLQSLEKRDAELARLNAEGKKLEAEIQKTGKELSEQRRKVIPRLAKAAARQLQDLGFVQSHFDVSLKPAAQSSTAGLDEIEFQFAPNLGEPPRPLRAIASSGEMSRVMLALKTVLAAQDEIPVLVFDEIDANVGGETAAVVGEKMRQIADRRQVLCITHLPAVAACAQAHYVVTKKTSEGRTISEVSELDHAARLVEIARMLGGQSDGARRHAAELLKKK